MNKNRIQAFVLSLFTVSAAVILSSAPAHALIGLGIEGGVTQTQYSFSGAGVEASGGMGYTLGAQAELGPLEGDLMFTSRTLKTTVGGTTTSTSAQSIDIPVFFALGIYPVSVGVGGFYSMSMEEGGGTDFGVAAKAKVKIPLAGMFADLRYMYGLKKDANEERTNTVMLLVGLNIL